MLGALKISGIELEVIDLGIITHVVPEFQGDDVKIKKCACSVHALRMLQVNKNE